MFRNATDSKNEDVEMLSGEKKPLIDSKLLHYLPDIGQLTRKFWKFVLFALLFSMMFYMLFSLSDTMEQSFSLFDFSPFNIDDEFDPYPVVYANGELPNLAHGFNLSKFFIRTFKGEMTLEEANEKVYHLIGYHVVEPTLPVPRITYLRGESTCEKIFSDWMEISSNSSVDDFSSAMKSGDKMNLSFTLNGYSAIQHNLAIVDDHINNETKTGEHWNKIGELMNWEVTKVAGLGFGIQSVSLHNAMKSHRPTDQKGLVVGSIEPWVETFALQNGAAHVTTITDNQLQIQKEFSDRMNSLSPEELAKNWEKHANSYNFAVLFSTLKHNVLGDPNDPIGDVREIEKIRCLLKPEGILFLSVPVGTDASVSNRHRIYGSLRLAMVMIGFEWIATFDEEKKIDLNQDLLHSSELFSFKQYTFVLQKIRQM